MRTIDTIWQFKTPNVTVRAEAVEDCDVDLSFDESGRIARELENGELVAFGVIITVYVQGSEMGEASLWGCIYRNFADFRDHVGLRAKERKLQRKHKNPNLRIGSYFSGLVREAIAEARKRIGEIRNAPIHA